MANAGDVLTFVATGKAPTYQVPLITPYTNNATYTPTILGATTAGTTSYSTQYGYYTRIGNMVYIQGTLVISAATGTGNMLLGGFPFPLNSDSNENAIGTIFWLNATGWTWPLGTTSLSISSSPGDSFATVYASGSSVSGSAMQMTNASLTLVYSLSYSI